MKDFTEIQFKRLLKTFLENEYLIITFEDFIKKISFKQKLAILRHDIDSISESTIHFAEYEKECNIKATYYFPIKYIFHFSNQIKSISELDHNIGYHYNDLVDCKGSYEKAIISFENNLNLLRKICDVKTICMEGSPLSKWDNRDLWKKYNYKDFGILGEPYFDLDFNEVFYLTDTGRCWNGDRFNVRDKVKMQNEQFSKLKFHSTLDIIKAIKENKFPDKAMLNFHPQRWTDDPILWTKELVLQNVKNQVKKYFFVGREK